MNILDEFGLSEVIAEGLGVVLQEHLPTVVEELNAALQERGDTLVLPAPAQILSTTSTEAATQAGMPLVAIADMPAEFEDDLVTDLTASHSFYVHVVIQDSDHETLTKLLRRYKQAIAIALQRDRSAPLTGGVSVLSREGLGVWALMFRATEPGPLLGERDPDSPDKAPSSYLSWSGIVVTCKREEI